MSERIKSSQTQYNELNRNYHFLENDCIKQKEMILKLEVN